MSNQFKNILIILVLTVLGQGYSLSASNVQQAKTQPELILEGVSPVLHPFCNKVYFPVRVVLSLLNKEIERCCSRVAVQRKFARQEVCEKRAAFLKARVPAYLSDALGALDGVEVGTQGAYDELAKSMFFYLEEVVVDKVLGFEDHALNEELFGLCEELLLRVAANVAVVAGMADGEERRAIVNYACLKEAELMGHLVKVLKIVREEEAAMVVLLEELGLSSSDSFGHSSGSTPPTSPSCLRKSSSTPVKNVSFNQIVFSDSRDLPVADSQAGVARSFQAPQCSKVVLDPKSPGAFYYVYRCARLLGNAINQSTEAVKTGRDLVRGAAALYRGEIIKIDLSNIDLSEAFDV